MEREILTSVMEKAPDFIGVADIDFNVLLVNRAGQELVGLDGIQEVRGTKIPDYLFPEDRNYVIENVLRIALDKGSWSGELRLRHFRTGRPIPVMAHSLFRIDNPETGKPISLGAIIRDISDRKLTEQDQQRSFEQVRALAARLQNVREEERARVAREIHDQLGQALTAIKIEVSSLVRQLPAEQQQPVRMESILRLVDKTIHSVRRISAELRPGILDDMGLVAAIEWAAEDFERRTRTKCRLALPKRAIVTDRERATAVFRIFQEALTNITRHAKASEVNVRLTRKNASLILEVQDNGKGFSLETFPSGMSIGILGMRERVVLFGGELSIRSAPGKGTTVKVRIPMAPRETWARETETGRS